MNGLHAPRFAAGDVHSPLRVGILAHLEVNSPSTLPEIRKAWSTMPGIGVRPAESSISGALYKLREYGMVYRTIAPTGAIQWFHGAEPEAQATATAHADAEDQPPGQITPPRQFDVMRAPLYRSSPGPALRPGALDFQQYASRGVRC